jgi:hypothetical protein
MPSNVPLSISVACLATEHLRLLSDTDYHYIVTLNSPGASRGASKVVHPARTGPGRHRRAESTAPALALPAE